MSLVPPVLNQLRRPGYDMAIIDITDISAEHDTLFDFIKQCRHRATDHDFTATFLRPSDQDDGTGDQIVLATNPARIAEHTVIDTRIYIVEDTTSIKRSVFKYRIQS